MRLLVVRCLHIVDGEDPCIDNILQGVALNPFGCRPADEAKQGGIGAEMYEGIENGEVADALGGFGAYEHCLPKTGEGIDEGGAVALLELFYLLLVDVHGYNYCGWGCFPNISCRLKKGGKLLNRKRFANFPTTTRHTL